jgi:hypothetical protein
VLVRIEPRRKAVIRFYLSTYIVFITKRSILGLEGWR